MPHYHASSLPQSFTVLANSFLISFIVNMVNQNQIRYESNVLNPLYGYDFHLILDSY